MVIDKIALVLSIIGGINWGLIGFFRFDLVAYLFGGQTASASRVVYGVIEQNRSLRVQNLRFYENIRVAQANLLERMRVPRRLRARIEVVADAALDGRTATTAQLEAKVRALRGDAA